MNEAERRFQECLDRFSRELGDLVMRQVEEQVQAALAESVQAESATPESAHEVAEQLELKLEDLRPEKKTPSVPRVDPNSMLGSELSQMANLDTKVEATPEPAPPPAPTRPLFVHRRARDGRIHELSRVDAPAPASG